MVATENQHVSAEVFFKHTCIQLNVYKNMKLHWCEKHEEKLKSGAQ